LSIFIFYGIRLIEFKQFYLTKKKKGKKMKRVFLVLLGIGIFLAGGIAVYNRWATEKDDTVSWV
jgi:uncharacterized membrane protein